MAFSSSLLCLPISIDTAHKTLRLGLYYDNVMTSFSLYLYVKNVSLQRQVIYFEKGRNWSAYNLQYLQTRIHILVLLLSTLKKVIVIVTLLKMLPTSHPKRDSSVTPNYLGAFLRQQREKFGDILFFFRSSSFVTGGGRWGEANTKIPQVASVREWQTGKIVAVVSPTHQTNPRHKLREPGTPVDIPGCIFLLVFSGMFLRCTIFRYFGDTPPTCVIIRVSHLYR